MSIDLSAIRLVAVCLVVTFGLPALAADGAGGDSSDAGASAGSTVRVVNVPGSDVVLRLWHDVDPAGVFRPHFAISMDGVSFSEPRAASYDIMLRHGEFDPLGAAPARAIDPRFEATGETNLYIVQFETQTLDVFRSAIRQLGGTVYFFLPHHSHIVKMTADVRDAVAALPFVRWVGPYHPAFRLEEFLLANASIADEAYPNQTYNIMVFEPGMGQKRVVADRIAALGGIVKLENAGKYLLEATLTPEQLFEVVRWDEVLFVDRWSPYETDMAVAREIGGANFIEGLTGFSGEGVRGEVMDVGFNLSHVDFNASPLIQHGSVGSDSHGASTSGIIFGDGTGNGSGRGLIPDAQGIVSSTASMEGQSRYDNIAELKQDPYYAVFQSASVGSQRTMVYTTISADMDALLFDHDFVICQSQSNAGNRDSRPQAWAKNIISVGGAYHQDSLSRDDDSWNSGASIGPADDGRNKPDLCHFYDDIFTVTSGSSTAYTTGFGGTSGATPIVAGHVGIFFQMWSEGIFQNPIDPAGTVFENRSHMTTCKALMINTASQYDWINGSSSNDDLDRAKQGWGIPDLQAMYELRNKMLIVDETDILTNMQSTLYTVSVDPGEPMLRATLVFADPPGVPGASQQRINDLDLKVTAPNGDVYWGNNGLSVDLWSREGGSPSEIDTVENVILQNPEAGLWTIEVFATEINADGHVETFGALDADYALVVSGVEETLPALVIRLPNGFDSLVPAGQPVEIDVEISTGEEFVVPGTETLHYRFNSGDAFATASLADLGGGDFLATIPGAQCDTAPEFYISAEGDGGSVMTNPVTAPAAVHEYEIGEIIVGFSDDFEADTGWTVDSVDLTDGAWDRGVPNGGDNAPGDRGDPPTDADGSGQCFLTDNAPGNSDVDGGPTRLTSPMIDATTLDDPYVNYARWFNNDDGDIDRLLVEISNNDGATWTTIESVSHESGWKFASHRIADFVSVTSAMRFRFSATDNPNDSVTEAGIDAFEICSFACDDVPGVPGDVDGDLDVDFQDLLALLAAWGACPAPPADCPADFDGNDMIDFQDLLFLLASWTG